jgi:hypothetical protein
LEYAAHEARMSTPDKDGVTLRDIQTERLRKNLPGAKEALEGPGVPQDMEYLYGFATELTGRSGVGMSGANPLSFTTIKDWQGLTGNRLDPDETYALLRLDAVMRHPPEEKPTEVKPEAKEAVLAWPTKRAD